MISDPISDMLARIHNALFIRRETVLMPASKLKLAVVEVLKKEGFIRDFQLVEGGPTKQVKLTLAYKENREPAISGLKRVSRPGLRVYVQKTEIPRVFGGLGIAILSTPSGVMTGQQAWRKREGGELLCYVW